MDDAVARPFKKRNMCRDLRAAYFKPRGIPLTDLAEVVLKFDELETVRLADLEGLYHEEAAARMGISRATFGNTLHRAHKKIADALLGQKALKIVREIEQPLKESDHK
jgi:predicted DNA-binding protein (UPF0251 family)